MVKSIRPDHLIPNRTTNYAATSSDTFSISGCTVAQIEFGNWKPSPTLQGLAKLLDCLAADLPCLVDFHVCPPVSWSYCSLHTRPGSNPETGGQNRRDGCVQVGTGGRPNDTGVWWREAC
jgi:hypothetical protein